MKERRKQTRDRRSYRHLPEGPFRDSNASFVISDRSRTPDRRIAKIEVDWLEDLYPLAPPYLSKKPQTSYN